MKTTQLTRLAMMIAFLEALITPVFSQTPPSITVQPQGQLVFLGSNAVLNVTANGTPTLFYQWQKQGMNLANQTNAMLTLNNIQTANEGAYSVVVSNAYGSVTSSVVKIGSTLGVEWQKSFGGNGDDSANIVIQTSDGGYILGGYSDSGASGNKTNESFGLHDYWVVKMSVNGSKEWERSFGGSDSDYLISLQQTSDGGYILAGRSYSGASGNKTSASFGFADYWVVKMAADGNKQWEQSFGGNNYDNLTSVQQTSDGGYILGGISSSDISGNKTNANFGVEDYWLVKIDVNGNKQWDKSFGTEGQDYFFSLQQANDGGYVLGGTSNSDTSGNKTNAGFGLNDYWLVKVDANGDKQWEQSFGGNNNDYLFSLLKTSDGGYILGGHSYSGVSGNKSSPSFGSYDYWLVKVNSTGAKQWEKSYGGDGTDSFSDLQPANDGGYVLSGYSYSGASGNKTNASFGFMDYWVVTVDASGNKQRETSYNGRGFDHLRNMQQTSDGGCILSGRFYTNAPASSFGSFDYWAVKLAIASSPVILSHPQSQTNNLGSSVTLSVTATNAFSYQWRQNGNNIIGATFSSLTLDNFQTNHVGNYDVVVGPGDVISSNAVLIAIGAETNLPNVSITAPKLNGRITNNFAVTLMGTAKDTAGLGVAQVFYKLNDSPFQLASGTKNWSAPILLVAGTNRVEVKSVDFANNESLIVKRTFFGVAVSSFTLMKTGSGTIVSTPSSIGTPTNLAALEIGRSYKVSAVPGMNYVFSNWVGSATSTNPNYSFTMEENMTLTANFVENPFIETAGKYQGLFQEVEGVKHQTAGFFVMTVRTNFSYSAKLYLDGDIISMGGKFKLDGTVSRLVPRAKIGKSDLTLALALDVANGTDKATGVVSTASWTSSLKLDRATFNSINPATTYTNVYTMLVPGFSNPADGPPGYSYGSIKLSLDGFAKIVGETGDGMKLLQSVPISKNGDWPLYVRLYKSVRVYTNNLTSLLVTNKAYYRGSVFGWIEFTNNAPIGTFSAIKTGWTNAIYPNGFTNHSTVYGSRYLIPPAATRAVDFTYGTVTLTNGNLINGLTRDIFIKDNNAIVVTPTNNATKLSLAVKTGLLTGNYQHPGNANAVTPVKGVVLQEQNVGGGYFLGTNQGGVMLLEGQ